MISPRCVPGKTTLADSLLSRAGIISSKAAGDARFMQGRKDRLHVQSLLYLHE